MNRRSARNRHRRIVPWNGVTGIVAPSFNRKWHAAQLRRLEDERLRRVGERRTKARPSTVAAALLIATIGGGQ